MCGLSCNLFATYFCAIVGRSNLFFLLKYSHKKGDGVYEDFSNYKHYRNIFFTSHSRSLCNADCSCYPGTFEILKIKRSPRREKVIKRSLGEALKFHRTRCKMTQEFVAETIGVSRQAVSKWEKGDSDPSTSNLFALAKLYGISVEELLKEVE